MKMKYNYCRCGKKFTPADANQEYCNSCRKERLARYQFEAVSDELEERLEAEEEKVISETCEKCGEFSILDICEKCMLKEKLERKPDKILICCMCEEEPATNEDICQKCYELYFKKLEQFQTAAVAIPPVPNEKWDDDCWDQDY